MGKPYSEDLRKRVVGAVLTGGLSCNQAAKQFGVAVSSAIGWVKRQRETGSVAPGKMGGHRPKAISGQHRAGRWIEPSEPSLCVAWSPSFGKFGSAYRESGDNRCQKLLSTHCTSPFALDDPK